MVRDGLIVSRETSEALLAYQELLLKWNQRINLISPESEGDVYFRHIEDCLQLLPFVQGAQRILDIGSGAGLPGVVLAIAMHESDFFLVESDKRKSVFLMECVRVFDLSARVKVLCERVEDVSPLGCDIVVSRACAGLNDLLGYTSPHLIEGGKAVFLKGKKTNEEISIADEWAFDYTKHVSKLHADGVILEISHIIKQKEKR